jgi:hypothetical protein
MRCTISINFVPIPALYAIDCTQSDYSVGKGGPSVIGGPSIILY